MTEPRPNIKHLTDLVGTTMDLIYKELEAMHPAGESVGVKLSDRQKNLTSAIIHSPRIESYRLSYGHGVCLGYNVNLVHGKTLISKRRFVTLDNIRLRPEGQPNN